jgi:phospholipid transport system substrate-binding protein
MHYLQRLAAAALMLTLGSAFAADPGPDVLVRQTIDQVTAVISRDPDIQAGNRAKINALVDNKVLPYFDFTRMTQLALGKNWRNATPAQREALVSEFRALLVRTYALSLSQYRGEKIAVEPLLLAPDADSVTVKTRIQQAGAPVAIDYSMRKTDQGWKVYDVVVEGVSLVTNYRNTFNDQIQQHGIDGLVKVLSERNRSTGAKG